MKTKTKILVAALTAAGIVAPLQQAWADTITGPVVVPAEQQSVAPGTYSVSYPVTVTPTGGSPQALNFIYNSNNTWTVPSGWTYAGNLNNDANTAVFNTTAADGTKYGIALSSTGQTQFVPGQTGATVTGPSVGLTVVSKPVGSPALPGFGAATATGEIDGKGATTATLVGAPASVQVIGLNPGGTAPATASVGTPISVNPTTATATPGYAVGSVTVNSNQSNQSIGWGQYTVTVPKTNTPSGTTTIPATLAGSSGSVGANGIKINNISGTGTYNVTSGDINAAPVETAVFGVDTSGNTAIGGTLSVAGQTTTNGLTNNGTLTNTGNATVGGTLAVNGATTTKGITNTGALSTTTLAVTGASTTNGITNTGNIATTTLSTTGNATVGGTLTTSGISNTGNIATTGNATVGGNLNVTGTSTLNGNTTMNANASVGGTLGVTGATTLNGATQVNNTLGVTGATTIGSTAGTGGNTLSVNNTGILLTTAGLGANSVQVNSSGSSITGGGAVLAMANGRATFAGANGAPIRVTGIADGSNQFDAVNFGQFEDLDKRMKRGISGAAAVANIPQVEQGKTFNLGVGVGGFDGETAVAIGGSLRVAKEGILKASVGFGGGGGSSTVWGVGGGWSWQ